MVMTESTMLPLGTKLPPFALPEPRTGNTFTQDDVRMENGLLVVFMCNHCPFVVHLQQQLKSLGADLPSMGIGMVGISSNDINGYPQDGPRQMKQYAEGIFSTFKYLYDETQQVAKDFKASCTPDIFLFDKDLTLVYRGQIDASRPGNKKPIDGSSIRAAAKLLSEGQTIPESSMVPSIGCNIKWKPGNAPDYF